MRSVLLLSKRARVIRGKAVEAKAKGKGKSNGIGRGKGKVDDWMLSGAVGRLTGVRKEAESMMKTLTESKMKIDRSELESGDGGDGCEGKERWGVAEQCVWLNVCVCVCVCGSRLVRW